MTRRQEAIERLRKLHASEPDAYERGYLEATGSACSFMSIDALNDAADHVERHMLSRGVKVRKEVG